MDFIFVLVNLSIFILTRPKTQGWREGSKWDHQIVVKFDAGMMRQESVGPMGGNNPAASFYSGYTGKHYVWHLDIYRIFLETMT